MQAGKLNRKIEILEQTNDTNDYGERNNEWAVLKTVWAEKKDTRGQERTVQGANTATIDTVFKIRFDSEIGNQHRLRLDGHEYEITSPPVELGFKEALEIYCTRVVE